MTPYGECVAHPPQPPPPGHGQDHPDREQPWPTQQHPARNGGRRTVWLLAIGVGSVVVIGVGVTFGSRTVDGSSEQVSVGVSGDRSAWTAAICAPDSVVAPSSAFPLFEEATAVEYCMTRPSGSSGPQSVVIGEWPADATIRGDLSRLPQARWLATGTIGGRTTAFILQNSTDPVLLEPLMQFGFEISSP